MRVKLTVLVATTVFIVTCTHRAYAESRWSTTTGGTFDWNTSGNWQGTFPPGAADDVRITNDLGTAQLITNMGSSVGVGITNAINFLAISNGLGSASVTVQQGGGLFRSTFGVQIGKNATLILTTNSLIGTNSSLTFDLRPGGGSAGTLVLSNASSTSGFSTFLNSGGSTPVVNAGTIAFTPVNNQIVAINYGQVTAFTNNANGTVVMNGTGTGAFTGNFGSGNRAFVNNGSLFARAGTLRIDPRDAFSRGGFQNGPTGFVQVDSGATFEIRRTTNSWVNGPAVTNFGTVFMNGGKLTLVDLDGAAGNSIATNQSRVIANVGTIDGTGTFTASINSLSGSTVAPGLGFGTLNVGGNVTLGSNSTLSIQLGLLAGQNDLLAVASNLTLNANSLLSLSGGAVGNIYTVATAFAVSGTFGTVTPNYTVIYDPTDIRVQFVPEPSSLVLAAAGLLGLMTLRRRNS
ncbi:MAG TPA: PEP-CTERM sorting domain-containing protein [Verrucomicrobiae bacterium]|nr:PEP-CTERM sorting domain-containing protein [Verrucomicrobiae bacterium]